MKKDYYRILEVHPNASTIDIKRSYRRLALQYHPDKNNGNKAAEARFKEIQEAYRILSDEKRRSDYNRTRPYHYTTHVNQEKKYQSPSTPQSILQQVIELKRKVILLDPERMNKVAVYQQIEILLSHHHIHLLQQQNDHKLNKRIIEELLVCARYLPYVYVEKICFQLTAIAGTDNQIYQRIYNFSKQARLHNYWNRYKLLAAMIAAIILTYAIFKLSIL